MKQSSLTLSNGIEFIPLTGALMAPGLYSSDTDIQKTKLASGQYPLKEEGQKSLPTSRLNRQSLNTIWQEAMTEVGLLG